MVRQTLVLCGSLCMFATFLACNAAQMQVQAPTAIGQGFQQISLVADIGGTAQHTDLGLQNPWGIAFEPAGPFFIANNGHGNAKVVDPSGTSALPAVVGVPIPSGSAPPSKPTGIVFNSISQDFMVRGTPAQFLFATEDGTISTWASINGSNPSFALLARDDSASGAIYKGISILTPQCCREYLALAEFHAGFVATYDISFSPLATLGSFKDSNLPAGYAPFNIQQIGTQVFVTYALQDASATNPIIGPGNGIVNVFDTEGNFVQRFASNGPLNAPWGVAQASANFGPFSNDILIGNFGDGIINVFDPLTGAFLGQIKDRKGNVIVNPGLWALVFRADGLGNANTLYFTAGASGENHGLFGASNNPQLCALAIRYRIASRSFQSARSRMPGKSPWHEDSQSHATLLILVCVPPRRSARPSTSLPHVGELLGRRKEHPVRFRHPSEIQLPKSLLLPRSTPRQIPARLRSAPMELQSRLDSPAGPHDHLHS